MSDILVQKRKCFYGVLQMQNFFLNLIFTFGIYTLPIIIFRYCIHKKAFSISKAKRIAIIYGIASWLLMTFILALISGSHAGGSVFVWSYINYKLLVTPKSSDRTEVYDPVPALRQHKAACGEDPSFTDFCLKYAQLSNEILSNIAQNGGSAVCREAAKYTLEQRKPHIDVRNRNPTVFTSVKSFVVRIPNCIPKAVKETWPLLVIVALVVCLIIATSNPSLNTPSFSVNPDNGLTKQYAYNGEKFVVPAFKEVCPLTVSVRGNQGYYIYLKYLHAPTYSEESRDHPNSYVDAESDLAFYVSPDSSVNCKVPIGVYKLYYATGSTWYGQHDLFGSGTMYYTSSELLNFYSDTEYYNGTTLELWRQTNGNFETESIDASDFPS